jgi:hypothetical protein
MGVVALRTTENALIPLAKGTIFTFSENLSIKTFRITNSTNATVNFTLWFDPTGILAGTQQLIRYDYTIGRKETITIDDMLNPEDGGSITAQADTNNVLAAMITGVTR